MTARRPPSNRPERSGREAKPRRVPDGEIELSAGITKELTASARPGKEEIIVKVFSDALAAYARGDLETAIKLGDQAKHIALRSANVREFLGLAYYAAERWREAARELTTFRRISGTTAQNHVIGDSYRALGRPDKAIEFIDEMGGEAIPEDVYFEGQIVAAGAYADMGKLEEAAGRLLRLQLKPDQVLEHHLRAWYVLADLLERLGRFTQAQRWFQAVADTDPDLTDAPERVARLKG